MLVHSFCIGIARVLTRTAAYALFLVRFDAQDLPYVYIGISVVVMLLSFVYLKLSQRLPLIKLLIAASGFLLLVQVGLRFGLGPTAARWLVFALPIWYEVFWTITQLEFWNLAGYLFNVRQGKRLFGLIGAGEQVAIIAAGFLTPALVASIGTPNLFLAAAGAVAGVLGLLMYLSRSWSERFSASQDKRDAGEGPVAPSKLFKDRYVLLIFGLFALAMVVYFATDNVFYAQAEVQYPGEEQLAVFIGLFLGVVGLLSLLSRSFLTGFLMGRFGMRAGLLFTPVLLLATGVLAAVGRSAFGTVVFFWGIALLRLFTMVFCESIDISALNVVYQPLPTAQRVQTQAMVEGIVYSIAIGLAGLGLWVSTTLLGLTSGQLVYVLLLVLLAWVAVGFLLGREYPVKLIQALARRRLSGDQYRLIDGSTAAILQRELQSPHSGVVLYALNMLEAAKPEALPAALPALLDHPAPEVRVDVLQRIERLGLASAAAVVIQRLSREPLPAVRGTAVCTLAAVGEAAVFDEVSAFLEDPHPEVRRGAMVGLLRSGGIEGVLTAGHRLLQMADSEDPAERVLAAQLLGEVGIQGFYRPLVALLQDEDVQVQRAALLAAGQLRNAKLWPQVMEKLHAPAVREAAATALIAGGEAVLPELRVAFSRMGQGEVTLQPLKIAGGEAALPVLSAAFAHAGQEEVALQLVRIAGRIAGEEAITWLRDHLAHPDAPVRTQVLRSLSRCAYQARGEDIAPVREQLQAEVVLSSQTLGILRDIGEHKAMALLRGALQEALSASRERLFALLSFLYDRRLVLQARDNLSLASAEKRAYALEVLDVLVSPELKRLVFPLLSELPLSQQAQQLQVLCPQPRRDPQQCLQEIIAGPPGRFDSWTRACALYAAGLLPAAALGDAAAAALAAPEPLIRETAIWALSRLDSAGYRGHIRALWDDPSPRVAWAARQWGTDAGQEDMMLSTVEKVLILKRVGIFAATPDETLSEVAALLGEVPLSAGQTIFEKGDLGDCMYIIVDGEVRVHDGQRTLNHLHAGDVFGEMALLDAEPRVASITAVVDTQLLRLDQEPFYELLEDRSEVARGIIRVLSRHLRARVQDLNELRSRLEALEA